MGIVSIQSHVSYGHVGNSAAVFPLQRAGFEVWPVHTVNFSNHTEYPDWGGPRFDAATVREVLEGMERRGVLGQADALLTGYLGTVEFADVIAQTAAKLPGTALYCCDPVIGNAIFGDFVDPRIPGVFREVVLPHADVITPNQYEVARLTGRLAESTPQAAPIGLEETLEGVRELQAIGPRTVLVTSMDRPAADHTVGGVEDGGVEDGGVQGGIEMLAVDGDEAYLVSTPRVPPAKKFGGKFVGAGDVAAAVFTAQLLAIPAGEDLNRISRALEHTAYILYSIIDATQKAGADELELVACQDVFANPRRPFTARRV